MKIGEKKCNLGPTKWCDTYGTADNLQSEVVERGTSKDCPKGRSMRSFSSLLFSSITLESSDSRVIFLFPIAYVNQDQGRWPNDICPGPRAGQKQCKANVWMPARPIYKKSIQNSSDSHTRPFFEFALFKNQ